LRDWRPAASSYRPAVYYNDARESEAPPTAATTAHNVISVDTGFKQISQTAAQPEVQGDIQQVAQKTAAPSTPLIQARQTPSSSLTLIALRNETIYGVASYWLDGDNLDYILQSGARASCALNEVDLARTTQLNSERGIMVTFREAAAPDMSLSSGVN
jgi:hypothetical protein